LPHTHYLGKRLEGSALLPDGTSESLLSIPDWDFNWQGDYRYSHPVHLPAGTSLRMRFVYDNSAENPRNPNQPPREVLYGPQSSDEMGELWFQVRLNSTNDAALLSAAYNNKNRRMFASYDEFRLQRNPHDARARTELGFLQWTDGQVETAINTLRTAVQDDPAYDQPHYYLGVIYRTQNRLVAARAEFEAAAKLNPGNSKAFGNLAFVFLGLGNLDRAERSIREAVRLDPTDGLARETLDSIVQMRNKGKP
jgi:tetratricopeptide (TPR) repeat protein